MHPARHTAVETIFGSLHKVSFSLMHPARHTAVETGYFSLPFDVIGMHPARHTAVETLLQGRK